MRPTATEAMRAARRASMARLLELAQARAQERVSTSTLVAKLAVRELLQEQRRRKPRKT